MQTWVRSKTQDHVLSRGIIHQTIHRPLIGLPPNMNHIRNDVLRKGRQQCAKERRKYSSVWVRTEDLVVMSVLSLAVPFFTARRLPLSSLITLVLRRYSLTSSCRALVRRALAPRRAISSIDCVTWLGVWSCSVKVSFSMAVSLLVARRPVKCFSNRVTALPQRVNRLLTTQCHPQQFGVSPKITLPFGQKMF